MIFSENPQQKPEEVQSIISQEAIEIKNELD